MEPKRRQEQDIDLHAAHSADWNRWFDRIMTRLHKEEDRRAELTRRLPRILQPALTFLTGKAGDEEPLWKNTAHSAYTVNLATSIISPMIATGALLALPSASLAGGIALTATAFYATIIASGAARAGSSTFLHHSTHGTYPVPAWWMRRLAKQTAESDPTSSRIKTEARVSWNKLLGDSLSALMLLSPYDHYKPDHNKHHGADLATLRDPDWKFLNRFGGFSPGQSRRYYWTHLWRTLFSPRFHSRFLRARLQDNFLSDKTPLSRRRLALGIYSAFLGIFGMALALGLTPILLYQALWLLAIGPLYNMGSLLQLLSEHRWRRLPDSDNKKVVLARLTRGRYIAPPLPQPDLPFRALRWGFWWLRTALYDLPIERLWILPADLPSHAWHHRHVGNEDWANSAYALRDDIANGTPGWKEPYQKDVWGLRAALDEVFTLLSELPPDAEAPDDLSNTEEREVFGSM